MKKLLFLLMLAGWMSAASAQTDAPALNGKIIEYVDKVIGKKVDRGECWDIVNEALNQSGAEWESPEDFGKKIRPGKDTIYPGDIIAFKNASWSVGDSKWHTGPQHYAIVYEVIDDKTFKIAHQNINKKKKVIVTELSLVNIKGKIQFYRPQQQKQ